MKDKVKTRTLGAETEVNNSLPLQRASGSDQKREKIVTFDILRVDLIFLLTFLTVCLPHPPIFHITLAGIHLSASVSI